MRLRQRAWVTATLAVLPLILLGAIAVFTLASTNPRTKTDAVMAMLVSLFVAATVLSGLTGANTLYVLRTRHGLDRTQRSYVWAMRSSIASIGLAVGVAMVLSAVGFHRF